MTNMYRDLTDEQLVFLGRLIEGRVKWYEKNAPEARFASTAQFLLKELKAEYDERFPVQDWKSSIEIPGSKKAPR